MAISIHFKSKTASEMRSGLELHIERTPADVEAVRKETDSYIDGTQTQFNRTLYRSERLEGRRFGAVVREERDALREVWTGRKRQKNAHDGSVATLQLSNDTLELMGYEKFKDDVNGQPIIKPWSEQTEEAREKVVRAYQAMVDEVCSDRWRYGDVLLAQLHVDESTPHVEVVSVMIDRNDVGFTRKRILNGEGTPVRGRKYLKQTQTNLAEGTRARLGKEFSDAYKIERGEPAEVKGRKRATAQELERRAEKVLAEAELMRKGVDEFLASEQEKLGLQRQANEARSKALEAEAERLAKFEKELEDREWDELGRQEELKRQSALLEAQNARLRDENEKLGENLAKGREELRKVRGASLEMGQQASHYEVLLKAHMERHDKWLEGIDTDEAVNMLAHARTLKSKSGQTVYDWLAGEYRKHKPRIVSSEELRRQVEEREDARRAERATRTSSHDGPSL